MSTNSRVADDPSLSLGNTRLLDLDNSKLRLQALRITQLAAGDIQKAIGIHDFIKSLPFGCPTTGGHTSAAQVLKSRRGDCHSKGTLFVALLRATGIPARLRFVSLSGAFLRGILDMKENSITHAIGEVYLNGQWAQTDSYVADVELETLALAKLDSEGQLLGYGIHVRGDRYWNGLKNAHGQYASDDPSSLPLIDFGVHHDPELFYATQPRLLDQNSWLTRAKWSIAARLINRRTQQLRSGGASHLRSA